MISNEPKMNIVRCP